MDTVEVITTVRITKAKAMSIAQINKIIQGIKQCHCFPVEVKNGTAAQPERKGKETDKTKLTVAVEC